MSFWEKKYETTSTLLFHIYWGFIEKAHDQDFSICSSLRTMAGKDPFPKESDLKWQEIPLQYDQESMACPKK